MKIFTISTRTPSFSGSDSHCWYAAFCSSLMPPGSSTCPLPSVNRLAPSTPCADIQVPASAAVPANPPPSCMFVIMEPRVAEYHWSTCATEAEWFAAAWELPVTPS